MTGRDRQQHAVEVIKYLNKAVTNIRLYPEQSVQVVNAVESAYAELKAFLRSYRVLDFKLHKGVPTLDGVIFDRKSREQLDALLLVDFLDKSGLHCMALAQGIDRKRLKQILSVFTATPEQIQKSGGVAVFVEKKGLSPIFLDGNDGKESERHDVRYSFSGYLAQLLSHGVRQEDVSALLQSGAEVLIRPFALDNSERSVKLVAAAICQVLQILQGDGVFQISSDYFRFLENVQRFIKEKNGPELAAKVSLLLTANLTYESLGLLVCQGAGNSFGELLYAQLVEGMNKELFRQLMDFLRDERSGGEEALTSEEALSMQLLQDTCRRLMETAKGRQLHAQELMGMTEKQRQGKRLQAGLNALARGSLEGLNNKEIVQHLPATFERLIHNQKEQVAAAILQTLVSGLKLQQEELRLRSGYCLAMLGEKMAQLGSWDWLEKLIPTFLLWLRKSEEADETCEILIRVLQQILTHAFTKGNEDVVDRILPFFYAIRIGAMGKNAEFMEQVAQVQDKAVDYQVLQVYLDRCFVKPIEEMHCQKIVMHGPVGVRFLLNALLANTKRPERIRLLKILSGAGPVLSGLLRERLREPMPWYGKRNLLRLLGVTGSEEDVASILEFITHEDLRVQHEALSCLCRLSGRNRKKYLLDVLPRISEKLKSQVVDTLSSVVDDEVVDVLIELLGEEKYFSNEIKEALLISICKTLGYSGSIQAQRALQQYAGGSGQRPKTISANVWQALQHALTLLDANRRQLRQKTVEVQKVNREMIRKVQSDVTPSVTCVPVTNLAEELKVYSLLGQNRKPAAKKMLMELIATVTYLRLFDQADILCQRLAEIDPLAIDDIIQARELLEEQKTSVKEFRSDMNWGDVSDFLTTEEFNSLYSAMEHVTYGQDENIVSQGDLQQRLFFLNKGRVKLFHRDSYGNDILLKVVGPGEVFGAESFFRSSVWTVNAASVGAVDVFVLPREALRKWEAKLPGLEQKLRDFCQQLTAQDSTKVVGVERRGHPRTNFFGKFALAVFDDRGRPVGTVLQGENGDLSNGGMYTTVRVSQKRNIRLLLGRKALVSVQGGVKGSPLSAGVSGLVVAIYAQEEDLGGGGAGLVPYAVHLQFDQSLTEQDLAMVVGEI